jgi:hypothetical protein
MNGSGLCSTCRYVSHCSLSSKKIHIHMCNEYVHRLDKCVGETIVVSNEIIEVEAMRNRTKCA